MKPLTPLEDATVRFVLAHAHEGDGWLDLTRISSNTARMLPDVRQAVARLARRKVLTLDDQAMHSERWIRFLVPGVEAGSAPKPPSVPAP